MAKKIYITLTIIFLLASASIIGYIIKQDIESGKQENQNRSNNSVVIPDKKNPSEETEENIVIQNKEDAKKILGNADSLINTMENNDSLESN